MYSGICSAIEESVYLANVSCHSIWHIFWQAYMLALYLARTLAFFLAYNLVFYYSI